MSSMRKHRCIAHQFNAGPGYDQESTPGLVAAGATIVVFTTGNGTKIGNAITPVVKLASNNRVFEKMSNDLDISAGNVIEGTESITDVGTRLFEHLRRVASGEIQAKPRYLNIANFNSGQNRRFRCKILISHKL